MGREAKELERLSEIEWIEPPRWAGPRLGGSRIDSLKSKNHDEADQAERRYQCQGAPANSGRRQSANWRKESSDSDKDDCREPDVEPRHDLNGT
jgi:hypothetical protein